MITPQRNDARTLGTTYCRHTRCCDAGYYAYLSGLRYYCFPREEFLIQTLMGTCMNKLQTVNEIKAMFV